MRVVLGLLVDGYKKPDAAKVGARVIKLVL
jgi:hypothetical protein